MESQFTLQPELTVIIPHGGMDRLPLLATTLANLAQCREVDQIIVVELGKTPLARQLSAHWGADYVFGHAEGPFNKARAINIGCGLARYDQLLWLDNDIILPRGFVASASQEMQTGDWDLFFPYGHLVNLSDIDSRAVLEGSLHPLDCSLKNVCMAVQQTVSGGVVMVRTAFVRQYGGICEEFRGWGGEDNAWLHKVYILGRWAITEQMERTAYHLYHPDSGSVITGGAGRLNPNYAQNVELLHAIQSLRSPQEFLAQFPPPIYASLPWNRQQTIAFFYLSDNRLAALADAWAVRLQQLYGIAVQCVEEIKTDMLDAAAWVIFGKAALDLTKSLDFPAASSIAVLEHEALTDSLDGLQGWSWLLLETTDDIKTLNSQGRPVWHRAWGADAVFGEQDITNLVQMLALILGTHDSTFLAPSLEFDRCVWMYWEGQCPEWIRLCQATVKAHAENVRILDFDSFEPLWTHDRDIDLRRLHVAQRADFVRAYLLAEYGGLWVDSDCIVMSSLEPLLDQLATCGFIAHRERHGFFSNAFIGAQAGSPIARAFYEAICETLRSGRPFGWIALGNQPLTTILRTISAPWRELDCEQVQPICWSRPEVFFQTATAVEHAKRINPRAICYMLSNQHVQQHQVRYPQQNLLQENSFFRFLIDAAMKPEPPVSLAKAPVLDSSEALIFAIEALTSIAPARVLDLGSRYGFWAALLLELGELDPTMHIEAIISNPRVLGKRRGLYAAISKPKAIENKLQQAWHLILLDKLKEATVWPDLTMERLLQATDYVLVLSSWEAVEQRIRSKAESWPAVRQAVFQSRQGARYGVFLLSRRDPKGLRRTNAIGITLDGLYRRHAAQSIESIAGPGASISQTRRIREQLPLLLQDLGAESVLELPCSDCNWLSQIKLGRIEYIGGDPVAWTVEICKERHAADGRTFLHIDPATDLLPRVDVIICRDFWVHLSFADIAQVLANFRRSGSRYLLATTFTGRAVNVDEQTGVWRPLNLERAPFNFPPPIRLIDEKCTEAQGSFSDKALGLWLLSDV